MLLDFWSQFSPRARRATIFAAILFFVFINIWFLYTALRPHLTAYNTGMHGVNTGQVQLIGDHYYVYNGLGFYSVNARGLNEIRVLSTGVKLPQPSRVAWVGELGVLLNFSDSFIYTPVESLTSFGDSSRTNGTWFYDFSSKKISLVSRDPLYNSATYYIHDKKLVYYLSSGTNGGIGALYKYSVGSDTSIKVTDINTIVATASIGSCGSRDPRVCLSSTESTDGFIAKIQYLDGTLLRSLVNIKGYVISSNTPGEYVVFDDAAINPRGGEDASPTGYSHIKIYTVDTKSYTDIPYSGSYESIVGTSLDSKPALVDMTNNSVHQDTSSVFGGGVSSSTLEHPGLDDLVLSPSDIQLSEYGLQFFNKDNVLWVVGSNGFGFNEPLQKEPGVIEQNVKKCHSGRYYYDRNRKLFELQYPDDSDFKQKILDDSRCLQSMATDLIYYTFRFSTFDEKNGKITSD